MFNCFYHFTVQPSDDEEEDNEIDPVAVGCLAIFPFPGMDASPSKEISEAEYSPSKTDIGAATPGAVNTDPETQRAFRMQRALAEKRREKENLDLSQLQKQYMRMRRLQQKNMLVFNSILPQSKERRNPNPPSAINHLFIDIPKVETRTKGSTHKVRRHDNSDLVTEPKDDHSENTTPKPAEATNGKAAHFDGRSSELSNHAKPYLKKDISTSPLISVSLHALGKSSEPSDQHLLNNKAKVAKNGRNFGNVSSKPSSKSTHIVKSQNFTQPALFAIDRNALYPANFKPFPQRTHQPKSKLLAGAISQSTSTPATSNQSQHKLPSRLWPMLEL